MRFISSFIAGAALIASVLAVEINDAPKNAEVGKTYTIKYSPADDTPTTLILRVGDANHLETLTTLTTTATGGTYEWTVDTALPNGNTYALEIRQPGATPNYLGPFTISGSTASSSVKSSSAASSTASSTTSATSSAETSTLITTTVSGNGTSSIPTSTAGNSTNTVRLTGSRTPGTASPTAPGAPQNTGAASVLSRSPVALVLGAVAALVYLN